jgi:hypothetical protein
MPCNPGLDCQIMWLCIALWGVAGGSWVGFGIVLAALSWKK